MKFKFKSIFAYSASLLFGITAIAKIVSSYGSAKVLRIHDPVFGVSFHQMFLYAGFLELIVSAVCLFTTNVKLKNILIAWMATSIMIYRIGILCIGYHNPSCPCLGSLTDALHIAPQMADNVMEGVLAYLVIGSYSILFSLWFEKRQATLAPPFSSKLPP